MSGNNFSPKNIDLRSFMAMFADAAEETPFPPIDLELVKRLEALFPDRAPNPNDDDKVVWIKTGRAEVVRFLA
jgi:hypothetical protein